jgi:23S rRNA pseudouridine955/2504/2580 synthase
MELITGENDKGRRLDRVLRKALPDHPLPLLHRLLRQGKVLVDGKPAKAQDRVDCGAKISIPALKDSAKTAPPAHGRLSLDIIWQDKGLLAVNKPAGIAVHGPESLETAVRSFLEGKLPPSLSFKSGPLHRLDKPSSGIVVFSTSLEGARLFSSLLRERKVKKTYLAIVEGCIKNEEIWEDALFRDKEKKKTFVVPPGVAQKNTVKDDDEDGAQNNAVAGKPALTKIKPLVSGGNYSLISAQIATGRTHQIRAQASSHGHPLAGDRKYGGHGKDGLFLHAWKLEFLEYSIEAPLPQAFREKVKELFGAQQLAMNS